MIYFLKADLKIKIGFTDDPPKRISQIQDRERLGSVTITVLRNLGASLGYDFEYRFSKRPE